MNAKNFVVNLAAGAQEIKSQEDITKIVTPVRMMLNYQLTNVA